MVELNLVPSLPYSGESFGLNVMHTVGGSMGIDGMGSDTSGLHTVSVTVAVGNPASWMMSPATASSRGSVPSSPVRYRILVTLPVSTFSPFMFSTCIGSPTLHLPETTRP
eukprot:864267-Rhodomonas_salina.1